MSVERKAWVAPTLQSLNVERTLGGNTSNHSESQWLENKNNDPGDPAFFTHSSS